MSFRVFITTVFVVLAASQIYWLARAWGVLRRRVKSNPARLAIAGAGLALYAWALAVSFEWFGRRPTPIHLTPAEALRGLFLAWLTASLVAFLVVLVFAMARGVQRLGLWAARRSRRPEAPLASPSRRQFLERSATAAVAVPFVAGAYGLFYGRLNLEITRQRIRLHRLPKAFEGFRIAQISDVHIGPFMTEDQIRRYVRITNDLKPDLIVLTGDFITWDPGTQRAVVTALSGLKAPHGVFGCLGNHEAWSNVTDSITALFAAAGIPILRRARTPIAVHGESLNLIGVDYDSGRSRHGAFGTPGFLEGVGTLVAPDTVNILLSHNPNTFDRAAELGIDLSLAGHTHGGQVSLEFISPNIAPSRLVTPYVAGWFQKPGGQLYVNRGLGTFFVPVRAGAPPEITVYELT